MAQIRYENFGQFPKKIKDIFDAIAKSLSPEDYSHLKTFVVNAIKRNNPSKELSQAMMRADLAEISVRNLTRELKAARLEITELKKGRIFFQ